MHNDQQEHQSVAGDVCQRRGADHGDFGSVAACQPCAQRQRKKLPVAGFGGKFEVEGKIRFGDSGAQRQPIVHNVIFPHGGISVNNNKEGNLVKDGVH
jgi:hypothetical protein